MLLCVVCFNPTCIVVQIQTHLPLSIDPLRQSRRRPISVDNEKGTPTGEHNPTIGQENPADRITYHINKNSHTLTDRGYHQLEKKGLCWHTYILVTCTCLHCRNHPRRKE